jgi:hypothetical protein
MRGRGEHIVEQVTSWPGVTTEPGRFGEIEFLVDGEVLGHVHGDDMADIPFPRALRDELVAAGRTEPHHRFPDSDWTTRYLRTDGDADAVIDLIHLNYTRVTS